MIPLNKIMKRIFNTKIWFAYLLIASLAFAFISCDDDDIYLTYFRCQLNGIQYKTPNPTVSFESKNEPVLTIRVNEPTITYSFYTRIYPEDKSDNNPNYYLSFMIHRNEPLEIGEVYFISKLSEEENLISNMDMESVLKDYVHLSPLGEFNDNYGSGSIQIIEYNDKENYYKGIVDFQFDLSTEGGKYEKVILKGEFCAVDY